MTDDKTRTHPTDDYPAHQLPAGPSEDRLLELYTAASEAGIHDPSVLMTFCELTLKRPKGSIGRFGMLTPEQMDQVFVALEELACKGDE